MYIRYILKRCCFTRDLSDIDSTVFDANINNGKEKDNYFTLVLQVEIIYIPQYPTSNLLHLC